MELYRIHFKKIIGIALICLLITSCKDKEKAPIKKEQLVEKVFPMLDTENSRWFFFSSANRPFGMVNLSPDTEINGAWGSGYRYAKDTIKGFSHIHAWQMSGLSVMPVTVNSENKEHIFTDFYSKFSHNKEQALPGYHYTELERYAITTELTSTKRVGFHKYTYPKKNIQKAILFNLNTMLGPCENTQGTLKKDSDKELSGQLVMQPTHRRPKPVTVFFKIKLNIPLTSIEQDNITNNYLLNIADVDKALLMKVGISYTSIENANNNINEELPDWDFNSVVANSKTEWNGLLERIKIEGGTEKEQSRFYTDLWHALQGRRVISDYNGAYPDNTGETFRIGQLPLDSNGKPKFNHYNSDSFWGAQWTINTLWGLVYPEIMEEFTHSLMQYYKDGGLVPRGPSGGNYTYVMTGATSTPFIVTAIQKNIIKDSLETIYTALKKNHMLNGIMGRAGYEHNTQVGGGLNYYIDNGYVPYPFPIAHKEGEFGIHMDGTSQTNEYAYQDWTLAQLAKKLNKTEDYNYFLKRSNNYKNVFNTEVGWMAPKDINGQWKKDFDPYQYETGFTESNGAQSTWFVPQDIEGLASLMGGNDKAVQKLDTQFKTASKLKFTSGTSHAAELHPEYSRVPINYGNQPSIQTAFIFNKIGRPDLTQYWSRQVVEHVFSGLSPLTGYNGDEDQGLMGSLAVLMKMGIFQMNGGTEENPEYQIGSPVFKKITIKLHPDYATGKEFVIQAENNSEENIYVNTVEFNNKTLNNYSIKHNDITNGGTLVLKMNKEANTNSGALLTEKR